jgi:[protein-PII] uridylyltransferase
MSTIQVHSDVLASRDRLNQVREQLRKLHNDGLAGRVLGHRLSDAVDGILLDFFDAAVQELPDDWSSKIAKKVAVVPHGGFGRREMAPYSDIDVMVLCEDSSCEFTKAFVRKFSTSLYDLGVDIGFSLRTPAETVSLSLQDATILSSLTEARYLAGSVKLFRAFAETFRSKVSRTWQKLIPKLLAAREEEHDDYGATVYLLEPNVKRSGGALRDIHLARWVGFVRYGDSDLETLRNRGHLHENDCQHLLSARQFLLRLRNELHFSAGRAHDLLERHLQLEIARKWNYEETETFLAVEGLMQDYFDHTREVSHAVENFVSHAQERWSPAKLFTPILTQVIDDRFRMGPVHISVVSSEMSEVKGNLEHVLRLVELANVYGKRIEHTTWYEVRAAMIAQTDVEMNEAISEHFMSFLSQPWRLEDLLRRLHEIRALEKVIPDFAHTRSLIQFNQYHKYTVDEHTLRAVGEAAAMGSEESAVGDAYRAVRKKSVLHLALLLHDIGKGFEEDHSTLGARIAEKTCMSLGLPLQDVENIRLLVLKHLNMSKLALYRDITDKQVVLEFAKDIGNPELLKMLFVLTCADMRAVGPGVLNNWRFRLITELYKRALSYFDSTADAAGWEEARRRRAQIMERVENTLEIKAKSAPEKHAWWQRQIAELPETLVLKSSAESIVNDLTHFSELSSDGACARGIWLPRRKSVRYTVGGYAATRRGSFHRLAGVLTSRGMNILEADIYTLADGLIFDRFYVSDNDFEDQPPEERMKDISEALTKMLRDPDPQPPKFRTLWGDKAKQAEPREKTKVVVDNDTSKRFTILDISANDRTGILYSISKAVFDLGLGLVTAKIGTHGHQVIDVFYVVDAETGGKVTDEDRLQEIRERITKAIDEEA